MKHKRRESREIAFSLIFEWGFKEEETLDDIISQAEVGRSIHVDSFAYQLSSKTIANRVQLDKMIEHYSKKWKLNRIPRVTLAALRMSFCELSMMEDIPVGATINEAVELVKKYATEEDAAYVNGLLGQFERDRNGSTQLDQDAAETVASEEMQEEIVQQSIQAAEKDAVEASMQMGEVGE